jgi:hypothetical protein
LKSNERIATADIASAIISLTRNELLGSLVIDTSDELDTITQADCLRTKVW